MMEEYRCRCGKLTYAHDRIWGGWSRETLHRVIKRLGAERAERMLCKKYRPVGKVNLG